ncbi:MAG TPA: HepT-like ribonuclease domain-containing protein [Thermoanaerobaculia bacterium]
MLDLARRVAAKVAGLTRADFDGDENLRLAVTHLLQTIGEAARHTSEALRSEHPEVPWAAIVGMRHKVVHDYFEIDEDVVWVTATERVPPLIDQLLRIVQE